MGDLAVGLAKWVVEGTLRKAQAAIAEEAKLRDSAQRDLVFITGEFQMMQSFLTVANAERVENPVVITWVRQIRELADDVEDCIEFVIHLDKSSSWRWRRMIPSWCLGTAPLDEAVYEIEQLKARVEDVSTRNARYSLISDTGSKPVVMQQLPAPASAAAAAEAVRMLMGAGSGTRQQQGDLTQLLANPGVRVISVWGRGGDLGVTSVIWKAYNDKEICESFTCRAWVKLRHPFNPHEFVRCVTDQFYANACKEQGEVVGVDVLTRTPSEPTTQGDHHLNEFVRLVKNKRTLVVLEDLSTMTDWDAISKFFPDRKNGSCIIVSSQQSEVASLSVGHPYQVLELNQFSVDHSVYAFYKERSQSDGDNGADTTGDKKNAAHNWMTKHHPLGRDSELNELRQYTSKARFNSIQVMSVWGIAGIGKSALLRSLFCDRILEDCKLLKDRKPRRFEKYAWVDVSYPFNLRDFARSLLLSFHSQYLIADKNHDIDTVGSKNPIAGSQEILKQYRCLVVIDGLQSTKEWDLIEADLVSGSSKNCIIITTTEASVAKGCRGNKGELVFNVKGLQADAALDLFRKEVSSQHALPDKLQDSEVVVLQELISKCGGLPRIIVAIADSLASKSAGRMEGARSINKNFMHDLENNREFDNLQGLFNWMHNYFRTCPDSLKPCIFYLSIFPRDRIIRRRRLVRRWIAEGYSRDNHEESAELNGEKQFSDLLELSIIQQPPTTICDTRMVLCQVNGFIQEYIVARRMEENLVVELGQSCTITTQRTGRHLVILEHWDRDKIMFESMDFSRLRSLTVFGQWESFFISPSMKLLRVLDLEDASGIVGNEDLQKMVKWLRRLKFLSLRGRREIQRLPKSLDSLRQLQSLDVRHTSIVTLPQSITKLEKLQYIRAGAAIIDQESVTTGPHFSSTWFCKHHPVDGAEVPRGIGKLTALHTLGVVNIAASGSKTFVKDLKKLTQLRKLGVSGVNRKNSKKFFSAIKGHVHLESLSLRLSKNDNQGCCLEEDNNQDCLDDMVSVPCNNLKSLKLHGLEDKLPTWASNQLSMLVKLEIEMTTLLETDVKLLGELAQLSILRIKQLRDGELCFRITVNNEEDESYRSVKVLQIACGCSTSSLRVTFGEKTMKKLELLKVDCRGGSPYQFSGLKSLEELKEVLLIKGTTNTERLERELGLQLAEHPSENKKPVVKLEEPPRSS